MNCDYCGTPLTGAVSQKRKTEAEVAPYPTPDARSKGGAKRKTEVEPLSSAGRPVDDDDPFDPFRIPRSNSGSDKPQAHVAAALRKHSTVYDPGPGTDPFQPPAQASAAGRPPPLPRADGEPAAGASVARRIVGWLVTFDGNPDGVSYVLREGRNVIGRDADSDIVTPADPMVSSTHAYLIWRAGRARVADANTQNGTFLNEEDVLGQVEVKDNDVIRVGRTRMLVRLLDQEKVAALWKLPVRGS